MYVCPLFSIIIMKQVQDPGSQSSSINAADADIYDEEAERRAFQEAVSAWRKGGQTETQKSKATVPAGNVSDNIKNDSFPVVVDMYSIYNKL